MAGHRLYQDLYQGAALGAGNSIPDPGPGGAIDVSLSPAYVGLRSAGTETASPRRLRDPKGAGLELTLAMEVDNGDLQVWADSGLDNVGNVFMTFNTAGDFVHLESIVFGTGFRWRIVGQHGTGIGPA